MEHKTFKEKLKELRNEKGLSQKEFAAILQTTDDSVFSWEKGRSQPSIETIRTICAYFNVSADYLLGIKDKFTNLSF